MAVSSSTEIMNSALIKLGLERIGSEDDASNRARLMKEQYAKRRDSLLRAHPWRFATARVELALVDPEPTAYAEAEYEYVYQLPTDCLRVIGTSLDPLDDWAVEDRYFLCNSSEVWIKYIKRVTDVSKFDDNFCEVLALDLAADLAFALTQSVAREETAKAEREKALAEARSFNAQQGSVPRVVAEDWLNSRY
jgi:hypothetical protein